MMRIHSGISGIRKELLHNLKTPTVKKIKLIKFEELKVKGMRTNHKLGLAISNLGFDEFRRQLEYKCTMYGATRVLVERWFPSSFTCSICGKKQDKPRLYQD
jgi:putative transposase